MDVDLLVLGTDREGIEIAVSAARAGRRVAIVESPESIPLDVLRQAGEIVSVRSDRTIAPWRVEANRLHHQRQLVRGAELERAGVDRIFGCPHFVSSTAVEVKDQSGDHVINAAKIVLACGTQSLMPQFLRGDARRVVGVESILNLPRIPNKLAVVGAGQTGLSASMLFVRLGVEVVVVDEHQTLMEIFSSFGDTFDNTQTLQVAFRLDDEAIGIEVRSGSEVAVRLASGRAIVAEAALVCSGRIGNTGDLNLEVAGVGVDERGRVWCDSQGRTWNPTISVVGDLIACPQPVTRSTTSAQLQQTSVVSLPRTRTTLHPSLALVE